MVGFCLLCNWNNMERFFIRERLICRGEDQNKLAWKNLTLLNQNMILKTTFLYFEEVCWKHFEMKSVWSAGLTLRLTRPSGTRNLHLDEKSFRDWNQREDLCCSFTVLRQMKVLRFTPAVTWKRRPLMFFTEDALGWFFSIQFFWRTSAGWEAWAGCAGSAPFVWPVRLNWSAFVFASRWTTYKQKWSHLRTNLPRRWGEGQWTNSKTGGDQGANDERWWGKGGRKKHPQIGWHNTGCLFSLVPPLKVPSTKKLI